jgi:hypothetical protein
VVNAHTAALGAKKGHVKVSGLFIETEQKRTMQTKRALTLTLKPSKKKGKK